MPGVLLSNTMRIIACRECNLVFCPVVKCHEPINCSIDELFINGGWIELGRIICFGNNADECNDLLETTGFGEKVFGYVKRALIRFMRKKGVEIIRASNPLFSDNCVVSPQFWFYLRRGNNELACHICIDYEFYHDKEGGVYYARINLVCD